MVQNVTYTAGFKLQAVEYALEHRNCAAERNFGIDQVRVHYWRKQHDNLHATHREGTESFLVWKNRSEPQQESMALRLPLSKQVMGGRMASRSAATDCS